MSVMINPCPWCGNTKVRVESKHNGDVYWRGTHSASVRCSKCHARGPTASCKVERHMYGADELTKQKAIDLWNNLSNYVGSCEGCKHIGFRYPYASMYPCNNCVRANSKDYYNADIEE